MNNLFSKRMSGAIFGILKTFIVHLKFKFSYSNCVLFYDCLQIGAQEKLYGRKEQNVSNTRYTEAREEMIHQ